jgi:hypothetical protein
MAMKPIYFCVALVAGLWSVSVGHLAPIPVGGREQAIALARATAQDLWQNIHVPTCVQVKDAAGGWQEEHHFGSREA